MCRDCLLSSASSWSLPPNYALSRSGTAVRSFYSSRGLLWSISCFIEPRNKRACKWACALLTRTTSERLSIRYSDSALVVEVDAKGGYACWCDVFGGKAKIPNADPLRGSYPNTRNSLSHLPLLFFTPYVLIYHSQYFHSLPLFYPPSSRSLPPTITIPYTS